MYAVEKLSSYITRGVYTVSGPFHPFGGAVDIIVVQQQDGSFKSSPWYVRFGKFQGVLKTREKVVSICVNGAEAGFHMYLDHKGEAFFLRDVETKDGDFVVSSPPSSGDETDEKILRQFKNTPSFDIDGRGSQREPVAQMDTGSEKIVSRTASKRGIFGLMFGRRSMKENGNDLNAQRVTSMERAEFAADLLETKWSTNLPANDRRADDSREEPSDKDGMDVTIIDREGSPQTLTLHEGLHHDVMINSHGVDIDDGFGAGIVSQEHFEEVIVHSSTSLGADEEVLDVSTTGQTAIMSKDSILENPIGDNSTPGLDTDGAFEESIGSRTEGLGDNLGTNMVSEVHSVEAITQTPCSIMHEEVLEIHTLETGDLAERTEVVFKSVTTVSNEHDVSSEGSILKNASSNVQSLGSSTLSCDSEHALNEIYGGSTSGVLAIENGEKDAISFSYFETVESSNVKFGVSTNKAQEAMNLSSGPGEQSEHRYEVTCETSELISKVKSQPDSGPCTDKENLDRRHHHNLEMSTAEGCSSLFENPQADRRSNGAFEDTITNGFCRGSLAVSAEQLLTVSRSSSNVDLISSESEVIYRDKETMDLSQDKKASAEPIVILGNYPQINEEASTRHGTHIPTSELVQPLCSSDKSELQSICNFPDSFNSSDKVQEVANLREGLEVESSCLSNGVKFAQEVGAISRPMETAKVRVPLSESTEDDQFLFSDIDSFEAKGVGPEQSLNDATTETDDHTHSLLTGERDIEEHETKDTNDEQSFERFSEVSRTQTSPMNIPRSRIHLAESELLIRSLPIIRSHVHDFDGSDLLHPLSCSLNLDSERNEQGLLKKDMFSSLNLEADSETEAIQGRCISDAAATAVDAENWGQQKGTPISPAVELSLCRHLLFEGMGADAASQAFNAEKVNLEKFSALGPSIVKNERLVVRIGDRYFPWDAAAPIILGMVSFGQGEIFEPQAMIAVDRAEENLKGDATGAMVTPGGSWRLWPFGRKSKSITTVRSAPEGTIVADVNTASVSTKNLPGSNDALKAKTVKKKEQSLTPTSEELASLNLKEGPNAITFTFSTAMLGRQQVDARIYLWKWNTRIVVSDVDGTITKSDVLGQFMPLVGRDWSQTGVTHLFSAIKENGYQLLFLSARAISQAYITRQFLFNLKQDGKALPDGPVVISPDGLFPSLYREVIRRAPHEFKISCLEGIRAVFPRDCNPFYAGFGNRDTDEISYLKVGIPKGKIFIINPKGEVAVNRRVDTKSYTSLHALVNGMFPPMSSAEQEDFNNWNYWKLPLPDFVD